jgi:hypothetical protein
LDNLLGVGRLVGIPTAKLLLLELLAFLNDDLGKLSLELGENARVHVHLGDLLGQGFFQAVRVYLKNEF